MEFTLTEIVAGIIMSQRLTKRNENNQASRLSEDILGSMRVVNHSKIHEGN